MELRQLRSFVAVAEELHFGRAAARLHLAPPSLSQQIRVLERSMGASLFERAPRAVTLTPAGKSLLARARRLLAEADAAAAEVRALASGRAGHLRVGLFTSNAGDLTVPILRYFQDLHPAVSLSFHEVGFAGQISSLEDGEVDVAFVRPPLATSSLDVVSLVTEGRMALVPTASHFADADTLGVEDLESSPFIEGAALPMPDRWTDFWTLRQERGGDGAPYRPAPRALSSYAEVVMDVAMNGTMTTVPASLSMITHNSAVTLVPVRGLVCDIAVATRADAPSPLAREFVEAALAVADSVDGRHEAAPSSR